MFRVLRLNARTFPVLPAERAVLDADRFELIEAELPGECGCPGDIDAVMIVSAYFTGADMARFPRCRIISRLGNGCDKIDLSEAARRGIPVANVPDSFSCEVADHTVAMMLSCLRKLPQQDAMMRRGTRPLDEYGLHRISGMTLGIIGFGRIGRLVAARASAFGMAVAFTDGGVPDGAVGAKKLTLPELLRVSDVLTLQCPLNDRTRGMLGMREFRQMKPGAVIVNTGRGELIREDELAEALRDGVIAGAALDVFGCVNVFTEGGFPTDHPLFSLPNVLLTPHVAANSVEGRRETHARGAAAVAEYLSAGILPENIVNREEWEKFRNV